MCKSQSPRSNSLSRSMPRPSSPLTSTPVPFLIRKRLWSAATALATRHLLGRFSVASWRSFQPSRLLPSNNDWRFESALFSSAATSSAPAHSVVRTAAARIAELLVGYVIDIRILSEIRRPGVRVLCQRARRRLLVANHLAMGHDSIERLHSNLAIAHEFLRGIAAAVDLQRDAAFVGVAFFFVGKVHELHALDPGGDMRRVADDPRPQLIPFAVPP